MLYSTTQSQSHRRNDRIRRTLIPQSTYVQGSGWPILVWRWRAPSAPDLSTAREADGRWLDSPATGLACGVIVREILQDV